VLIPRIPIQRAQTDEYCLALGFLKAHPLDVDTALPEADNVSSNSLASYLSAIDNPILLPQKSA